MSDEAWLPPITRAIPDDDNPDRTETLWPALVLNGDGCSYDDDWQRMTLSDLCALVAALPDDSRNRVAEAAGYHAVNANLNMENLLLGNQRDALRSEVAALTAENARLREELAHAREAERERCAKVAEYHAASGAELTRGEKSVLRACAGAIRSIGDKQ
jgi:hypothetical protein